MRNVFKMYLILSISLLSGCASAGMNGMCGRITGQELSVPYVGGKANVDGFVCHVGCVGFKCANPDYTVMESVMNHYADAMSTSGKIMTQGPGTVTFTPIK